MEITLFLVGGLSLLIWLYLIFLRGGFWRADQQLDRDPAEPAQWPGVAALIATSDDAEAIEETLPDILAQSYPGPFHVVLVDSESRDGTVEVAQRVAQAAGASRRLSVLSVGAPPAGWSRRAWALAKAQEHVAANLPEVRYLWLIEPWVQHDYYSLHDLVAKAEADRCSLVSLLPLSTCEGVLSRLLAPAFAFLFQALHPLPRVNDPKHKSAATTPGCVLVEANALKDAGGFHAFKDTPIPEGALAATVKSMARRKGQGIWLGLGENSTSVRSGDDWQALRDLTRVSNEAWHRASVTRWAAGTIAVALACLAPPVVLCWALVAGFVLDIDQFLVTFLAMLVACAAWAGMSFAAWPTFRLYGQEEWHTLLLPLSALAHILLTLAFVPRLPRAVARPGKKKAAAVTKDKTSLRSGALKAEPRLHAPSQPAKKSATGHTLRHRIARS